jgi:hypothetical protein
MRFVIAEIGIAAFWLLIGWLVCAIAASYLSGRKGFGEKVGLASGMILTIIGVVVWLVWPARDGSDWKVLGPFGRSRVDEGDAVDPAAPLSGPGGPGPSTT